MPRSYIRTLPDLYERKAFGTDTHPPYPPAAIACFVGVLCFGEQQPERGRFKSRRLLSVLLEGPLGHGRLIARQIAFLVEHGDLVERPDGSLYVEGWDELQEGNWQVAERMSRYRARPHGVTVAPQGDPDPVTPDTVTPSRLNGGAVTGDPSRVDGGKHLAVGGRRSPAGDAPPNGETPPFDADTFARLMALAEELTGKVFPLGSPLSGFGAQALDQAERVPWGRLETEWRRIAAVYGRPTVRQLVFDAESNLSPAGLAKSKQPSSEEAALATAKAQIAADRAARKAATT